MNAWLAEGMRAFDKAEVRESFAVSTPTRIGKGTDNSIDAVQREMGRWEA
jgi:hypothetical protein